MRGQALYAFTQLLHELRGTERAITLLVTNKRKVLSVEEKVRLIRETEYGKQETN